MARDAPISLGGVTDEELASAWNELHAATPRGWYVASVATGIERKVKVATRERKSE